MCDLILNCGLVSLLAEIPLPQTVVNYPYKPEEGIWSLLVLCNRSGYKQILCPLSPHQSEEVKVLKSKRS